MAPAKPANVGKRSFTPDDIYALEPASAPSVIRIDGQGHASRFVGLPKGSFPNGIAFDTTGAFGYRLLVSLAEGKSTTILSIDYRGTIQVLTHRAPQVEGGMVVAPASFGAFAGDLIAPDELNGMIYAIDSHGVVRPVADSGLPHGGDIGVESEAFVPTGFSAQSVAYLADRSVPGNLHPGTNTVLKLAGSELERAGVHPGDLLVASEGGAQTISIRCSQTCSLSHIGSGPTATHAEGHIVFSTGP
ncbi:MAG TPA: hypothetical protein VHU17_01775 [Acidimicrobiales bacterium]|nr:hypothetical protein [Acidimicrobiales bacterium]